MIRSSLLSLLCLAATALPLSGAYGEQEGLKVVTLHPLLSEWTERLAGDAVEVECVLPTTVNLHQFDPSPSEMVRMQNADLILAMGKHLEPYLDRLTENLPSDIEIYEAGRLVPSVKVDPSLEVFACCPVHSHGAIDPHWWHSPVSVRTGIRHLGRELEKQLPDHKREIRKRTRAYMEELEELHDWAESTLAVIPGHQRKLVTAHAAFGYLCVDYDFQAIPVKGLANEGQPTPGFLADTIQILNEEGIRAVFPERSAGAASLEAIREATGVRVADPLIADFIPREEEDTYMSMFRQNILLLARSLGAPPAE
jgi:zinc/manganese transport system substrate-binding protein